MELVRNRRDHLASLAVETVVEIFGELDTFTNVISFAVCAKYLNEIWKTNEPVIVNSIAPKVIVAFEDALLAIRATKIAEEYITSSYAIWEDGYKAEKNGGKSLGSLRERLMERKKSKAQTPKIIPKPKIDPNFLGSRIVRPTLEELRCVRKLYLLVSCALELGGGPRDPSRSGRNEDHLIFLRSGYWLPRDGGRVQPYNILPTLDKAGGDHHELRIHRYRVYSSMYRVFLAGAMLAPAYLEPFFSGDDMAERLLRQFELSPAEYQLAYLRSPGDLVSDDFDLNIRIITKDESDFLSKYTPYNILKTSNEAVEEVYGPLLEYLLDCGRRNVLVDKCTLLRNGDIDNPRTDSDIEEQYREVSALHQVLMLFLAQEILRRLFVTENALPEVSQRRCLDLEKTIELVTQSGEFEKYTSMKLIIFGQFDLENIYFPSRVSDVGPNTWLVARGFVEDHIRSHRVVRDLSDIQRQHPWENDNDDEYYKPWPEAGFFIWAVKKLGFSFESDWFSWYKEDFQGEYFFEGELFWVMAECFESMVDRAGDEY